MPPASYRYWNLPARHHDRRRLAKVTRENGLIAGHAFLFPFEPVGVVRASWLYLSAGPWHVACDPQFCLFSNPKLANHSAQPHLGLSSLQFISPTLSPMPHAVTGSAQLGACLAGQVAAGLKNKSLHWPFLCRGAHQYIWLAPKQLVCPGFTNISTTEHEQRSSGLQTQPSPLTLVQALNSFMRAAPMLGFKFPSFPG